MQVVFFKGVLCKWQNSFTQQIFQIHIQKTSNMLQAHANLALTEGLIEYDLLML